MAGRPKKRAGIRQEKPLNIDGFKSFGGNVDEITTLVTSQHYRRVRKLSKEQLLEACHIIANGVSLRKTASFLGVAPSCLRRSLLEANDAEVRKRYTHAQELKIEAMVDECMDIADEATDPGIARVRIDTRKWLASKILPKKYGDRKPIDEQQGKVTVNVAMSPVRKELLQQQDDEQQVIEVKAENQDPLTLGERKYDYEEES